MTVPKHRSNRVHIFLDTQISPSQFLPLVGDCRPDLQGGLHDPMVCLKHQLQIHGQPRQCPQLAGGRGRQSKRPRYVPRGRGAPPPLRAMDVNTGMPGSNVCAHSCT